MNRNGQCAMEVDDFCAIAGQEWTALWPEEARPTDPAAAMAKARSRRAGAVRSLLPDRQGRAALVGCQRLAAARRRRRRSTAIIATSRDVTERIRPSALREAAADEMRHRLRNNYVVVGSLLVGSFARQAGT